MGRVAPGLSIALLLTACGTTPVPDPAPVTPAGTEADAPPPAPPREEPIEPGRDLRSERLTIAAVGDIMLGTDYPENHLPDDDGIGFLQAVTPWLSEPDLTFGNLEGVLLDGGEPGKKCSNPKVCYLFRSPPRYAKHLSAAGFDVMSVANNHARDFGEDGRLATMQTLAVAGIRHSGLEGDFATLVVNELNIAVLAYAVTKNSNMMLDYEIAFETIAKFSAMHDIVMVSFHGGAEGRDVTGIPFAEEEYFGEPRGDVVLFARGAVDAGADLVVGHGPHVVRGMERYRERLIAYSLGNFATYYGISVDGIKGLAPILVAVLDGEGRFIEGQFRSTVQIRPGGPVPDPQQRALKLVRGLSRQDFGDPGLQFGEDGRILPVSRGRVEPHVGTN